jgi:hypothetical protein
MFSDGRVLMCEGLGRENKPKPRSPGRSLGVPEDRGSVFASKLPRYFPCYFFFGEIHTFGGHKIFGQKQIRFARPTVSTVLVVYGGKLKAFQSGAKASFGSPTPEKNMDSEITVIALTTANWNEVFYLTGVKSQSPLYLA